MVVFTCDACGESLRKNAVEKHYKFKCRSCSVLTCIDCQKDFPGDTYVQHTKCITEDEKYGGKNYQAKASANKGEKKQNAWIENLQDVVASRAGSLDADVKSVVDTIITFENIPRKKPKFMNFAKNVLGGGRRSSPQTLEKTWELLQEALQKKPEQNEEEPSAKKMKVEESPVKKEKVEEEAPKSSKKDKKKSKKKEKSEDIKLEQEEETEAATNGHANGASSEQNDEESSAKKMKVNEESPVKEEKAEEETPKSSKKDKKKSKKKDKSEDIKAEQETEEKNGSESSEDKNEAATNGHGASTEPETVEEEEVCQGVKKFKGTGKKRKCEGVADTPAKKEKIEENEAKEEEVKSSKKYKKKSKKEASEVVAKEETSDKEDGGKKKFDWESAAVSVLEKKEGSSMKEARLKKKVMKSYWDSVGSDERLSPEEKTKLEAKMTKKLKKSDKLAFEAESVSLVGAAAVATAADTSGDEGKGGTLVTEGGKEDTGLKAEVAKMLSELKNGQHNEEEESKENGSFQGEMASAGGSFNQWERANLGDDSSNEKFRRLMGLGKNKPSSFKNNGPAKTHGSSVADRDQVTKMFSQQEDQFKRAVGSKRGMGLGFGAKEEVKPQNKKITFDD